MPLKDGYQTAKELNDLFIKYNLLNKTKVIAVSGYIIEDYEDKYFNLALLKPIGIN